MGVLFYTKLHVFENADTMFFSRELDLERSLKEAFPSHLSFILKKYTRYSYEKKSVYLVPILSVLSNDISMSYHTAIAYLAHRITKKIDELS